MSCIVPNCKKQVSIGIPLPKDSKLRQQWLKTLNINTIPLPNSVICLKHFHKTYRTNDDDDLVNSPSPLDIEDEPSEEIKSCRLCLETECIQTNIFEERNESTIAQIITTHIPQIKISRDDEFSKRICIKCLDKLLDFHKFAKSCARNDETQRNLINKRKLDSNLDDNNTNYKKKRNKLIRFEEIQSELMKVLDENISNQIKDSDNIIIEVESDNGDDNNNNNNNDNNQEEQSITTTPIIGAGNFNFEIIKDLYDTEFCLINNYLFSFQLKKSNYYNLKCLTPNCPSIGIQNLLNNEIIIKIGHNHQIPTDFDKKLLIIFYIVKKQLKINDKLLNIKSIYDDICKKQPKIREILSLKTIMNHICSSKFQLKQPIIKNFDEFYELIENDCFEKLHFTKTNQQFYQERFVTDDGNCKAVVFANCETIKKFNSCQIMYVDASFKINTNENFKYQLITVLVWTDDSYYPILFALVNRKSQAIYRMIFNYLHNDLAPDLNPIEIITDYEANLYYALSEIYYNTNIGGSVFYFTQNLYKKICLMNLTKDLETDSNIRNIYHMLLMLPLLPVDTINDGLENIEQQANSLNLTNQLQPLFDYIRQQWINNITPELFCVHRQENRINENVIAPFKKLRDFLMLTKSKIQKQPITIVTIVEKLIDLEQFLQQIYDSPTKKSFARDLSSTQKKNVIKAWQFIDNHPKINIVNFFTKVLGYIKCMENQLWIWGYYRYNSSIDNNDGNINNNDNNNESDDELISAGNFSIISTNITTTTTNPIINDNDNNCIYPVDNVVIEAVLDENNELILKNIGDYELKKIDNIEQDFQNSYIEYVNKNE